MPQPDKTPLSVEDAKIIFLRLLRQYGLQWTASVPKSAWDEMHRCNEVLSTADRRAALGLPSLPQPDKTPLSVEDAKAIFRRLVRQYGLQWTASVPKSAWDEMHRCNKVLTAADRRAALGLPN